MATQHTYEVRTNCAYLTTVIAANAEEAVCIAEKTDPQDWDSQAWTPSEAELVFRPTPVLCPCGKGVSDCATDGCCDEQ